MFLDGNIFFEGTKRKGDSWHDFITNAHFRPRTKDDIYGKIYTIDGKDIWLRIYDKKTNKLLDTCTWRFRKEELEMQ